MNTVVRKDDVFAAFALGTAANFPWEMAHSLLYRNTAGFTWQEHLLCCGLASLADGVGIAAIFGVGAVAFREPRWTRRTTPLRWSAAALMGLAGAVAAEKLALRLGWWAYEPTMPRVPGSDLGISPLVQFVVLPLGVLFWALPRLWNRQKESGRDAGS
ncbi:MAG TPA: hypothetical protein VNM48_05195 [Chloroflexota bacterium]|nr:hypothetical protein [Chloroflexota bacterium]